MLVNGARERFCAHPLKGKACLCSRRLQERLFTQCQHNTGWQAFCIIPALLGGTVRHTSRTWI